MLFHDIAKPQCRVVDEEGKEHYYGHDVVSAELSHDIMKRLKFDNDTLKKVETLVRNHDLSVSDDHRAVRRAMNKLGKDMFPLLIKVKHADVLAQSDYMRQEKLSHLARLEQIYNDIIEKDQGTQISDLMIDGSDIIALGVTPGPGIGEILKQLLELVLDDPEINSKERLLTEAKKLI